MGTGEVNELGVESTGRWLVYTNNTCHVLDLDAQTYERHPGPASGRFAGDSAVVRLTRVETWPQVGSSMMLWFDDPDVPWAVEHWRVSSPVRRIVKDAQKSTEGSGRRPAGTEAETGEPR